MKDQKDSVVLVLNDQTEKLSKEIWVRRIFKCLLSEKCISFQPVYDLFLRFLESPEFVVEFAKPYISERFILNVSGCGFPYLGNSN